MTEQEKNEFIKILLETYRYAMFHMKDGVISLGQVAIVKKDLLNWFDNDKKYTEAVNKLKSCVDSLSARSEKKYISFSDTLNALYIDGNVHSIQELTEYLNVSRSSAMRYRREAIEEIAYVYFSEIEEDVYK